MMKWEIYQANLDPVLGSEQGKSRPVLIISEDFTNNLLSCINILPITSRKPGRKIYPNEVLLPAGTGGLPNESLVLCHQIRTIDKKRLARKYGAVVDPMIRSEVFEAIAFQLGIPLK